MTSQNLNVALFPMQIKWKDKESNLATLCHEIENIHPQTDLLILPEMFSTGFLSGDKEDVRTFAERNTGNTIDLIKSLAHKHQIAIAGSYIADSGGSLYNRAFFIEPNGEETFADKKHLFTPAGEDKVFSHGYDRMNVRFRGWNISMIVCYDIRFPVWCRNVNNEYDLLISVSNWPTVRIDALNKLLVARAIENLSYVCGVNCAGTDTNGFEYGGEASAIDFKGKDITANIEGSKIKYASLNFEKLMSFREKFPAWKDADEFKIL